ncbi:MAG: hypothetical protein VZR06_11460 [Butyrivibrio sp.]|nr:hypothetical protein [Butyrivibrio sp.]
MSFSYLGKPKTIDELKDYYQKSGYANKTRFFVGYNFERAKAFGIYLDESTGEYVVYKNKDDGSRKVRYRGKDEEFAVSELYERLQLEIDNQRLKYAADMAEKERSKRRKEDDGLSTVRSFDIEKYPARGYLSDCYERDCDRYSSRNDSSKQSSPVFHVINLFMIVFGLFAFIGWKSGGYVIVSGVFILVCEIGKVLEEKDRSSNRYEGYDTDDYDYSSGRMNYNNNNSGWSSDW